MNMVSMCVDVLSKIKYHYNKKRGRETQYCLKTANHLLLRGLAYEGRRVQRPLVYEIK